MTFKGNVLALDLATTTGWAYGKPRSKPTFGSIRFIKPGGSRAAAYRSFRKWLESEWNVRDAQPDLIVYESANVQFMAGRTNIETIKLLIGLTEHLEEWCHGWMELREATTAQVRAHFLGQNLKSAVAKPATVERCRSLGWMANTSDEADALALWNYQCSFLDPEVGVRTSPLFQKRRG
jgi:hypothetical protein